MAVTDVIGESETGRNTTAQRVLPQSKGKEITVKLHREPAE
jgi:molybdopterin-guanine dinucleotide biosynthesis protein